MARKYNSVARKGRSKIDAPTKYKPKGDFTTDGYTHRGMGGGSVYSYLGGGATMKKRMI